MGVLVLRWPEEAEEAGRLSDQGIPHLLLVSPDAAPPDRDDPLEEWVRLPADDRDIRARMMMLEARASRVPARPEVDDIGRVFYRGRWILLSPIEQNIMRAMVAHYGEVVTAEEIKAHAWPSTGEARGNALRVHITRLRRRLAPLGLQIVTLRDQGFVLQDGSGTGPANPQWPSES